MIFLVNKDGIISFKNSLIISILFLIIFAVTIIIFRENIPFRSAFSDIWIIIINILATISLFYAAKKSKIFGKRDYLAWLILGLGQLSFAMGDITYGFIELYLNQNPQFSISDIFYLLYYPIFAAGIFLLPRIKFNRLNLVKMALDISIVTITTGLMFAAFLMAPLMIKTQGNLGEFILFNSYIVLDFILLFALLDLVYNRLGTLKKDPLLLLAAGIAIQVISDIFFGYQTTLGTFTSGSLIDMGWITGFILVGLAGILQANRAIKYKTKPQEIKEPAPSQWTAYLPFMWIIIAYLVFAWSFSQHNLYNMETIIWVGSVIIILILIRQVIAYHEINNLFEEAENEISKRLKAEEILKHERDKAQKYLDVAGVLIIVLDHQQNIILINKKACEVFDYYEHEIMGHKWPGTFVPDVNKEEIQEILNDLWKGNFLENKTNESPIITKTGFKRIISWNNSILLTEKGEPTGILCSGEDITERINAENLKKKNAEEIIKRQNALLNLSKKDITNLKTFLNDVTAIDSKILNVERVSVWFFNASMTEIYCKNLYKSNTDTHEEGNVLKAKDYPNYFNAIKKYHSITSNDARKNPLTSEFSESYLKPLGIVSMMDVPIWLHGELIGVLCHEYVGKDIRIWTTDEEDFASSISRLVSIALEADERSRAEAQIKESLKEKEVLIKEIHHRVKNNMQIISSLLSLQSRQIKDSESAKIFKESQSRVKSMSMIHERLYQSKTLSSINFSEYIESLSRELLFTYAQTTDNIQLEINAENIQLNIDTAIPCGLILTEIISNSLKYAFPEGKGTISIDFYKEEKIDAGTDKSKDIMVLKIADDGIGMPESIDFKNTSSLGLLLVNSLIEQIDGEINLDRAQGTKYTIKFQEINYEERI